MRPLSPAERAAILAAHPGVTEKDLDAFEALLSTRFDIEPPTEAGLAETMMVEENESVQSARRKLAEIDQQIADMQQRMLPNLGEALARVNPRNAQPQRKKKSKKMGSS